MKNGTRKKTSGAPTPLESSDLRVEIAKRAYEIWLNEGGGHGSDLNHWLQAERELAGPVPDTQKEASA